MHEQFLPPGFEPPRESLPKRIINKHDFGMLLGYVVTLCLVGTGIIYGFRQAFGIGDAKEDLLQPNQVRMIQDSIPGLGAHWYCVGNNTEVNGRLYDPVRPKISGRKNILNAVNKAKNLPPWQVNLRRRGRDDTLIIGEYVESEQPGDLYCASKLEDRARIAAYLNSIRQLTPQP